MKEYIYIYGINSIYECIISNMFRFSCLYVNDKLRLRENNNNIIILAQKNNIDIKYVSKKKLFKLTNKKKNQNIVLEILKPEYYKIDELMKKVINKEKSLVLILDQILDPYNFGSILRTCDMFGVDGVFILNKRQVGLNSTVAKVSARSF